MKLNNVFFPLFACLLFSCKARFVPTSHSQKAYSIEANASYDTLSPINNYLIPFRDSLAGIMNIPIGNAEGNFIKEKPGGSLGNLITDAMYTQSTSSFTVHGVIYNYGGMRIPEIKKGTILLGKMYELLPFDNELVVLSIKGSILIEWLSAIGNAGGWPIYMDSTITQKKEAVMYAKGNDQQYKPQQLSASITLNEAMQPIFKQDTLIKERPDGSMLCQIERFHIHKDSIYHIATNDYLANGGDNCNFLKGQPCLHSGLLIRDVVINYIKQIKIIQPDTTKRILIPTSTIKKNK